MKNYVNKPFMIGSFFSIAFLFTFSYSSASNACAIPLMGPMPICGGISIDVDSDIYVVESFEDISLSNVLIGKNKTSSKVLNIEVGKTTRPITVVLSNWLPTAVRFTGSTKNILNVIILGSRKNGWDQVAVSGIDHTKLKFLPVIGRNNSLRTRCGAPPQACIPDQYFNIKRDRPFEAKQLLDPAIKRKNITKHIIVKGGDTIKIPASGYQNTKKNVSVESELKGWRRELELYKAKYNSERVHFTLKELLSPTIISIDNKLPSWLGIEKLVGEGKLRDPIGYGQDSLLDKFSEKFSKKYRSRLDPDFKFSPPIDLVISRQNRGFTMPRDLRNVSAFSKSVIVLADYPVPKLIKRDKSRYCLFFLNSKLARKNNWDAKKCTSRDFWTGSYFGYPEVRQARAVLKAAETLVNHKKWRTKLCHLIDIPTKAKVVVLATEGGRVISKPVGTALGIDFIKTPFGKRPKNAPVNYYSKKPGRVDVKVEKPGNNYLVLKSFSNAEWNFEIAKGVEISGVLSISRNKDNFLGLPKGVPVKHIDPNNRALPDGCRNSLLRADPLVGGPALLLFELMFKRISNRSIDSFLSKGIPPLIRDQTSEVVREYSTFVVR